MENNEYIYLELIKNKSDSEAAKNVLKNYNFEESAKDLKYFLYKHIDDKKYLEHLLAQISKKEKSISMRNVFQTLEDYQKKHNKKINYTKEERDMLDTLMFLWT